MQDLEELAEGALQERPDDGGQRVARGGDGALGGRHDVLHGVVEILRAQNHRGNVQLQLLAAHVDLGVAASQGNQGSLSAKCFYVGSTVP